MANEYSTASPSAPFADEKDWQFEQLIAQKGFWARFQRALGREDNPLMQEIFAEELPQVFELRFRRGLTIQQMVGYRKGEQWDEEGVTIALAMLEVARDKWEILNHGLSLR